MPNNRARIEVEQLITGLVAMRDRLPEIVRADFTSPYNKVVNRLRQCLDFDPAPYLVSDSEFRRVSRFSYMSDFETEARTVVYDPPEIDRDLMLTKMEALLGFVNLHLQQSKSAIGFTGKEAGQKS